MTTETTLLFGIFVFLALGLSIMTFVFKIWVLGILAAGAWLMNLGIIATETTFDNGFPFAAFFGICAIVMIASLWFLRHKDGETKPTMYSHTQYIGKRIEEARQARRGFKSKEE
jgi:hypothetical protein